MLDTPRTPPQLHTADIVALPLRHRARSLRDMERGRRAADGVRAAGGSAMAAALAQIDGAFDQASVINVFKRRVERFIVLGAGHPEVRARYGARADMLRSDSLDGAIARVERWYRTERDASRLVDAIGFSRGRPRLSLQVLTELRVILRLLRAGEFAEHFPALVALVRGAS